MKAPFSSLFALGLLAITHSSNADTFKLKDGRTLEGKVVSESSDSYTLLVEIKKNIRDEITVKKSEVKSIEKTDPSVAAFEPIKKLLPTPDLLEVKDYERLINEDIARFLRRYPNSKLIAEAKKVEASLMGEMEQIAAGAIKLDGKIIPADERALNQYELDAYVAYAQFARAARSRAFGSALTKLELMEKEFRDTKPFRDAAAMATRFLPIYQRQVQKMADESAEVVAKRDRMLKSMSPSESKRAKEVLDSKQKRYEALLAAAKKNRSKWLPVNRFDKKSCSNVLKSIQRETPRLSNLATEDYLDSGQLYRESLEQLKQRDEKSAQKSIQQFSRSRAPQSYTEHLKSLLDILKSEIKEEEQLKKEQEREARQKNQDEAAEPSEEKTSSKE